MAHSTQVRRLQLRLSVGSLDTEAVFASDSKFDIIEISIIIEDFAFSGSGNSARLIAVIESFDLGA